MSARARNIGVVICLCVLPRTDSHVNEYARSSVYVAHYHLLQGGGNLELAKELMEEVAESNAEEVDQAIELLKKIEWAIAANHTQESSSTSQVLSVGRGQPGPINEARG